jgi:uncharacterized protein YuzE
MRILRCEAADTLYVEFDSGSRAPAGMRQVAEGTLIDLGDDGQPVGLTVVCMHRDWTGPLKEILSEYDLSPAEVADLMSVAAA